MAKKPADPEAAHLAELIAIKRLLVFALIRDGATQEEIAAALGVAQSTVSGMVSEALKKQKGKAKKR